MDLTDEQILTQLKMRKAKLSIELKRVDLAIQAFQEVFDIEPLDYAPYMVDDKPILEDPDELNMAILMYNPAATYERKIRFVLNKLGACEARHITEYILKVDGLVKDADKLHERITYTASRMAKFYKIDVIRHGKLNLYSLKK